MQPASQGLSQSSVFRFGVSSTQRPPLPLPTVSSQSHDPLTVITRNVLSTGSAATSAVTYPVDSHSSSQPSDQQSSAVAPSIANRFPVLATGACIIPPTSEPQSSSPITTTSVKYGRGGKAAPRRGKPTFHKRDTGYDPRTEERATQEGQFDETIRVQRRDGGPFCARRLHGFINGMPLGCWVKYVSLDGSVYYYDFERRVVTRDNIENPEVYAAVAMAVNKLWERLNKYDPVIRDNFYPHQFNIVVENIGNNSKPRVFMLDHWAARYIEHVFDETPEGRLIEVIHEERTERYYEQMEAFPIHQMISRGCESDFVSALSFGCNERILEWNETPFPFSAHQARRLLDVYRDLMRAVGEGEAGMECVITWHVARTMARIERSRRQSKAGAPGFDMYRAVVPDGPNWRVLLADVLLAPILFGVQRMYRQRLESARVKGVVYVPDLRDLFSHFLDEWADTNLLATVFVGANIGFLAVSNTTELQQTASLVSALFSVMSVFSGVHHVWRHRTKVDATDEDAHAYFEPASSAGGLALLACFLALPAAALLWALLTFTLALGAFCVQSPSVRAVALLGGVLGLVVLLAVLTLLFFWHIWIGTREREVEDDEFDMRNWWEEWARSLGRLCSALKRMVLGMR